MKEDTYPCVCCGFLTRPEPCNDDYDICAVCFWENDPVQNDDPEFSGGANIPSLTQARINFKKFGAKEQGSVKNVRTPYESEYPK
ncbi:CPCC family cysteine-rich protein [Acinetobacter ursingii]|uniref:CPCC family cysteine-rich protein n=1 Tax=Acinetobacter ursingii TaxID=108980 RepID=UPI000CB00008|nr:CPCC family cysteine-rich protein [Acinetobacter ursingii]MCU4350920.1 hydrolase [Acinetobacter ursingii]MDI3238435.1 CPCC family cysteine-rich protein [Acinetobacter ursingii]PMC95322.1 hydrolase [Acinetobacter ursingii]